MVGRWKRIIPDGLWALLVLLAVTGVAAPLSNAAPGAAAAAPARIVAVGDLHGDYPAYHAILRAAGLVDARDRWTGGRTVFVQLGDVVDRGPDSLKIIRHLMRLQRQAARAGGRVVVLVGNHEAMNVTGDLRYVHPGEFAAFADSRSAARRERAFEANKQAIGAFYRQRQPALTEAELRAAWYRDTPLGSLEHQAAWRPEGALGRWAIGNPAVALIDGTLFVHGGISPAYAGRSIEEMNRQTAAALAERETGGRSIINDPDGPLWYRGLVMRGGERQSGAETGAGGDDNGDGAAADEIDAVLRAYGAGRIVIGHTPALGGIAVRHGGRLVRIDTGISAAYGGPRTYLEIVGGQLIPHRLDGAAPPDPR